MSPYHCIPRLDNRVIQFYCKFTAFQPHFDVIWPLCASVELFIDGALFNQTFYYEKIQFTYPFLRNDICWNKQVISFWSITKDFYGTEQSLNNGKEYRSWKCSFKSTFQRWKIHLQIKAFLFNCFWRNKLLKKLSKSQKEFSSDLILRIIWNAFDNIFIRLFTVCKNNKIINKKKILNLTDFSLNW